MFATAFNDRFFTYTYPQRLGGAIDWYGILRRRPPGRPLRGLGRDPRSRLLRPGRPGLPGALADRDLRASSGARATTTLLAFVGREGYRDPACDFADAPFDASTPHGAVDQRQSGLRPPLRHLDRARSACASSRTRASTPPPGSGSAAGRAMPRFLSDDPADPDSRLNRLWDGSVEPPFRIGMACGACHIAYDPLNPPADPDASGAGRTSTRWSATSTAASPNLLGSGLSPHRLEWQLIARARPGIVDTSALPMDFVSNPGTMNAIINFARRPTFAGARC